MGAAKKFWALPELGEGLVSFLDPLSTLQLAQSDMLDDLETSLTSKVWNELIRRSSLAQPNPNPQSLQKDLNALVRILRFKVHDPDKDFVEREKLSPLMMPLLHQICEACPWTDVEMVCPCRPELHSISSEGFLLLEKVEGDFGTTEQSLKSIDSAWRWHDMLFATDSRMSRQKETVTSICTTGQVAIKNESCVDSFIALLEAQTVSVEFLSVRKAELGEEDWQALAGALKAKGKPAVKVDRVVLSREDLTDARRSIFKAIWNATAYGFTVCDNTDGSYSQFVCKSEYEYGGAWTRLKQIAAMTEDEFTADCKLPWEEEGDEEEEHDGEEEESGEEDHDGEDEGDEEDG